MTSISSPTPASTDGPAAESAALQSAATLARSAEQAVRIAAMLHRMGAASGRGVVLEGEARLVAFEHLAARPASAACVVLDAYRRTELGASSVVARRVRELVTDARSYARPGSRTPTGNGGVARPGSVRETAPRFEPPVWRRLDEPLARLESRGLMRLEVEPGGTLRYRLEPAGIEWLESIGYPRSRVAGVASRVSEALREMAPGFCERRDPLAALSALDERLVSFRLDEDLPPGAPVVRRFFRYVLGEGLDRR